MPANSYICASVLWATASEKKPGTGRTLTTEQEQTHVAYAVGGTCYKLSMIDRHQPRQGMLDDRRRVIQFGPTD